MSKKASNPPQPADWGRKGIMQLGDEVKDIVTGFRGVVTGEVKYLTGCTQMLVTPKTGKENNPVDAKWLDIDRLHVVKAGAVKLTVKTNGFDVMAPIR